MLTFIPRCDGNTETFPDMPDWFSALLHGRGIHTPEEARRFLHPSLEDLYPPEAISGIPEAAARLRAAIAAEKRILVYGDYDVDGVCATAILLEALREAGAMVDFRIPSRHEEGYGLNIAAIQEIARDFQLLITVDCGISAVEEVREARKLGLEVIITDHHEPPEVLPPADVLVDPLLGEAPFRRLCGAGVALKLSQALLGLEKAEKWLDLAALATVADVVPLKDENRILVREGMLRMADTPRPGLRALMNAAGVKPPLRSEHLAFRLGPRINAAGRMEDASQAVRLLTTRDPAEAEAIARHLEENNRRRQSEEQRILQEARQQTAAADPEDRVLIAFGEGWNSGLIGLAAGKLCQERHLPTIVLSLQDGTAVGSCRSIPGVHIYKMLSRCQDLLIRYGGHAQAAGLTLPADAVEALRTRLNAVIRENCDESCFIPRAEYDLELPFSCWSLEAISWLDRLEPTGCENPPPVFLIRNASLQGRRRVGQNGAHLKLSLLDPAGLLLDGIAFFQGNAADWDDPRVDALYTPGRNEYQGRVSLQLQVQALQPTPNKDAVFRTRLQEISRRAANHLEIPIPREQLKKAAVSPEQLAALRGFLAAPTGDLTPEILCQKIGLQRGQALAALEICSELGLVTWNPDPFRVRLREASGPDPDPESSPLYRALRAE